MPSLTRNSGAILFAQSNEHRKLFDRARLYHDPGISHWSESTETADQEMDEYSVPFGTSLAVGMRLAQ